MSLRLIAHLTGFAVAAICLAAPADGRSPHVQCYSTTLCMVYERCKQFCAEQRFDKYSCHGSRCCCEESYQEFRGPGSFPLGNSANSRPYRYFGHWTERNPNWAGNSGSRFNYRNGLNRRIDGVGAADTRFGNVAIPVSEGDDRSGFIDRQEQGKAVLAKQQNALRAANITPEQLLALFQQANALKLGP